MNGLETLNTKTTPSNYLRKAYTQICKCMKSTVINQKLPNSHQNELKSFLKDVLNEMINKVSKLKKKKKRVNTITNNLRIELFSFHFDVACLYAISF